MHQSHRGLSEGQAEIEFLKVSSHWIFTCSKLAMETSERYLKPCSKLTKKGVIQANFHSAKRYWAP